MAKEGWDVTVIEKNEGPGGRAQQLKNRDLHLIWAPVSTGCPMCLTVILPNLAKSF